MRTIIFIAAVIVMFTFCSCKGDGTDSGTILPIDSKITIGLVETLNPAQRTLTLKGQTGRIYGCANYAIGNNFSVHGSAITLNYTDVITPNVCATAFAPASAIIDFGNLGNDNYDFEITVNGEITHAHLIVTDSSYQVTNGSSQWIDFSKILLWKIPAGCIWGNVQYGDPNLTKTYTTFIDSLVAYGAQEHVYPAGDYGYFELNDAGEVALPPLPHPNFVKTFIYRYNLDMLKIRALVKNYAKSSGSSIAFNLYGSNGEVYLSSVLIHE